MNNIDRYLKSNQPLEGPTVLVGCVSEINKPLRTFALPPVGAKPEAGATAAREAALEVITDVLTATVVVVTLVYI